MLTAFGADAPPKSNYDCRWAKMSDGSQQFICQEWPEKSIMPYLTAALVGIGVGIAVLATRGK